MLRTDSLTTGRSFQGSPRAGAPTGAPVHTLRTWPLILVAGPAAVAIWTGWVSLGGMCGFGIVHPLPGIVDRFTLNSAITLPIGMEAYAGYALAAWLTGRVPDRARRFARWSACVALAVGMLGQGAYHLMAAAGWREAPWPVTTLVACLPVAVLGMGVALAHLIRSVPEPAELVPDAVPDDIRDLERPLPEAPVSPARPMRSPAEWVAEDDRLKAARPELTARQRAELLGVSDRHIRNCRKEVTE